MNLFTDIESWLTGQGRKGPFTYKPLSGGCICESWLLQCADQQSYFVKTLTNAPEGLFKAEATGLRAIHATGSLTTPTIFHQTNNFLVLEYLPATVKAADYWEQLAKMLAKMHHQPRPEFGFPCTTYCGRTPQPNSKECNGAVFFAEQRLLYQAKLAHSRGLLDQRTLNSVKSLCDRLDQLIPEQPACLIHGDLWSGNLHTNSKGDPVVIDPACYWGWAEADIAMTRLFGGFPETFYDNYLNCHPFEPGWMDRIDIYNLYHLLNHLNLFGSSYYSQVTKILKRYL